MFIERATPKGFSSLQRSETCSTCAVIVGNIALRWSAGRTVNSGAINIWLLWSQDLVATSGRRDRLGLKPINEPAEESVGITPKPSIELIKASFACRRLGHPDSSWSRSKTTS
jgi:hypothetical protein